MQDDRIRKLYVDSNNDIGIIRDDFIVAIGKTKSNSIYHVVESKKNIRGNKFRFNLKVMKTDLITCVSRGKSQIVHPMAWYSRNEK